MTAKDKAALRTTLAKYHKTKDGRKRFTGIKKHLKDSQTLAYKNCPFNHVCTHSHIDS